MSKYDTKMAYEIKKWFDVQTRAEAEDDEIVHRELAKLANKNIQKLMAKRGNKIGR